MKTHRRRLSGRPEDPGIGKSEVPGDSDTTDILDRDGLDKKNQDCASAPRGAPGSNKKVQPADGTDQHLSEPLDQPTPASLARFQRRLRRIIKTRRQNRDSAKYCKNNPRAIEQHLATSPEPATNYEHDERGDFVAPARTSSKEWRCEKLGWLLNRTAQPGGTCKLNIKPCMQCPGCIRYELDMKALRYEASKPAELQTLLHFTAKDPSEAAKFRGNAQHNRRHRTARRISLLNQNDLEEDERGSHSPAHGVLLWDAALDEKTLDTMERHAKRCGMQDVRVTVMAVDRNTIRELMPRELTLKAQGGKTIETCRLVGGWARRLKGQNDWGDGKQEVVQIPADAEPLRQKEQTERSRRIEDSWQPQFIFQSNTRLTPEEKAAERTPAMPYLERARYINSKDWLLCMTPDQLGWTRDCIEDILDGDEPPLKRWHQDTKAPRELIRETQHAG